MATAADVRRLALALPETTEKSAWEQPTFRIRNKIFVSLDSADAAAGEMGFSIDKFERLELIAADPGVFFVKDGHDDNYNFARVRLGRISNAELEEVIVQAWRRIAPIRVRKGYDAQ